MVLSFAALNPAYQAQSILLNFSRAIKTPCHPETTQ
jgi:hypothetical protein